MKHKEVKEMQVSTSVYDSVCSVMSLSPDFLASMYTEYSALERGRKYNLKFNIKQCVFFIFIYIIDIIYGDDDRFV